MNQLFVRRHDQKLDVVISVAASAEARFGIGVVGERRTGVRIAFDVSPRADKLGVKQPSPEATLLVAELAAPSCGVTGYRTGLSVGAWR